MVLFGGEIKGRVKERKILASCSALGERMFIFLIF